jgi:hypothetical protein
MMMFLSILCACVLLLAFLVAMLGPLEPTEQKSVEMRLPAQPARFFGEASVRQQAGDDLAVDLMLAHIEKHVRLEQAAAENFLAAPTPENLRTDTTSPLAN